MNEQTLLEQYNDFKAKVQELKDQLKVTGEKFMVENFKTIFEKYPKLQSVRWTAYTPWFNDGEPCTYSSNHEWAEMEWEGENNAEAESEIEKFLANFDDDLMMDLFGDHVEIIVTAEGISVNEYDHD
jgi:hypothetical protein